MPEYRRFIAYFYEYIDGKKQKNAGFAKVELRNGMWRILFRLNTETEPLRPVRAYGFVREQGWQLGLYMGSMRPGVVRMEEWAYRADIPVWQGKYGFASLAGIWIQSEDGRRYVTVWDDEPVFTDRFVLALPKEAVNTENKEEKSEQVTERETESIHEKQTEENSDEKNETERQIHAAEISEAWEKEKDSVADEDQVEMVDAEDTDNLGGNAEAMPEEHISEEEAAAEVCEAFEDEMTSEEVPVQEEPHACRSRIQNYWSVCSFVHAIWCAYSRQIVGWAEIPSCSMDFTSTIICCSQKIRKDITSSVFRVSSMHRSGTWPECLHLTASSPQMDMTGDGSSDTGAGKSDQVCYECSRLTHPLRHGIRTGT